MPRGGRERGPGEGSEWIVWGLQSLKSEDRIENGIFHGNHITMKSVITIDAAGRLVLPKGIREKLHLRAGSKLRVELEGGGVSLRPEPDEDKVRVVKKGKRKVLTGIEGPVDAVQAVKADRAARSARVAEEPGDEG